MVSDERPMTGREVAFFSFFLLLLLEENHFDHLPPSLDGGSKHGRNVRKQWRTKPPKGWKRKSSPDRGFGKSVGFFGTCFDTALRSNATVILNPSGGYVIRC